MSRKAPVSERVPGPYRPASLRQPLLSMDMRWDLLWQRAKAEGRTDVLALMQSVSKRLRNRVAAQQKRFASYGGSDVASIELAAAVRDMAFRETLGSQGRYVFDKAAQR